MSAPYYPTIPDTESMPQPASHTVRNILIVGFVLIVIVALVIAALVISSKAKAAAATSVPAATPAVVPATTPVVPAAPSTPSTPSTPPTVPPTLVPATGTLASGYYLITNSSNGSEVPIIIDAAGNPSRGTTLDLARVDFSTTTPQTAVWYLNSLGSGLYTMTNWTQGPQNCLIASPPHLYGGWNKGGAATICGWDTQANLIANGQGVWFLNNVSGTSYTIQNASSGGACVIFGASGQGAETQLYDWSKTNPQFCGLPDAPTLVANKQAVFNFYQIA